MPAVPLAGKHVVVRETRNIFSAAKTILDAAGTNLHEK
ncbi:MAG: hypothetical protein JWL84_5569 [Rhodospirillales bacterium]|nr:hypothetical protein [Rhodospirillales bacterium]